MHTIEVGRAAWKETAKETGDHSVRSWGPDSFLKDVLEKLMDEERLPRRGVAVDFGCGSGRDLVYMASVLQEWQVVGLDNHSYALDRAAKLAEREGVSDRVKVDVVDLRKKGCLRNLRADLAYGCRFLHRPLLNEIRDSVLIGRKDATVIWSTFLCGDENLAPPYKKGRCLEHGELRDLFEPAGYKVIRDTEHPLPTRGVFVPASLFAAQYRSS